MLPGPTNSAASLTVDEGVENRHRTVRDARIWVNLFQDWVEQLAMQHCRDGKSDEGARRIEGGSQGRDCTFVDVGRVCLLPGLGALFLVACGSGGFLASFLLFGGRLAGGRLAAGGGSFLSLGRHD